MVLKVSNRQRSTKVDVRLLQRAAEHALPLCLEHPGRELPVLPELIRVEISLVSDRVISDVHRRFMDVPGPTDVITFPHGEIVISATTALRQASEFGQEFHRELIRYIVHGLLHLNGHEDASAEGAAAMWTTQEALVVLLQSAATNGDAER